MLELIKKERFDIFYVDGIINFNASFIAQVRQYSIIVFYQNLSQSRHLCDIFILPSLHQNIDFFREFSSETSVYQGLQYFLFHPIIGSIQPKKHIPTNIQKVAISTGGSDPSNSLLKLFKWIDYTLFPNINFDFFYGASYQHINKIPKRYPDSVKFKPFEHEDIIVSDFLISAFGVSTYEFLYLGMPIISFGHQESNAIASNFLSDKLKVIWSLGELNNPETLNAMIGELINNYNARVQLVRKAEKILDLKGPSRIIQILENSK
jgi:spore coat polysaccharide biosynthesis predicted glycosyltransferase SpsG